ncbi:MAG: hypothetical protein ACLQUZ_12830 [Rhizomicrobium sp.]
MSIFTSIESGIEADFSGLGTFLKNLVSAEFSALLPIAQSAVANLTTEEAAALASGDTKNTGSILASVVKNTTAAAEAAGIGAGASTILAAVGAAVPAPAPAAS